MATKWGIVSAGMISHDFTNALTVKINDNNHKVVAIAARDLKTAEEFAKKFDIPKAYGGYEQLAQDPEVEVVYVGAIHPAHLAICSMMLNAGKHVLCEKPMAMNLRETKELVALARAKKLFFMEAVWTRFLPAYRSLKDEVDKKVIGDVIAVNAFFGHVEWRDRGFKKQLGAGTTLDMGIYCIQLASLVFGGQRPSKVIAGGHLSEDGIDESVSITLLYPGGKTATLAANTKVHFDCSATVYGTEGKLHVPHPFWCSPTLVSPNGTYEVPPLEGRYPFVYTNSGGLFYEAQHVRECIKAGRTESPIMPLDETLLLAEIMEQVRKQVGVVYPQDDQ